MTKKLFYQALIKFVIGILVVGVLLFLPAGTFDYWQAWLLIAILFIPMFFCRYCYDVEKSKIAAEKIEC